MPKRVKTERKSAGRLGKASQTRPLEDIAAAHEHTRKAHASELAEDYVEAIAQLSESTGEARVVDLARLLGVSHVTVVRTLARLQKNGLVTTRPYRSIFLTDEGTRLASHSRKRHAIVEACLIKLGVPAHIARADAEGLEHHVSSQTLTVMERFIAK